jgi:general secretion pathway protein D
MASRKVDLDGTDSESLNFNINLGPSDSETATRIRKQKLDLKLSQVPLTEVLKHITKLTHTSFRTDDYSVIITPAGTTSDELISRSYRVPPDFLTSLSSGTTASDAKADPFAEKSGNTGLLTNRISAQEALVRQGVAFPDGASASYSSANNTLSVINTPSNQDTISQIVETLGQTEAVTISVRVTMIKTQKSNLDELSFDWLMSPFKLNGDSNLFASGGTVGSTHGRTAADFSPTVALPATPDATVNQGVVTNGLRSGDLASNENTIDNLIANPLRQTQKPSVAPGVLSLTGQFTDGQVQMLMRGLNQKKSVDVMARPSVLTRSGQAASVVISREFIYPSEYEPPQLPSQANSTQGQSPPVTPASPTAFKTKQLGISLEVLPVADAQKRYIDVTLNPSITEFDGFVNFGSPITSAVQNPLGGTSQVTLTENTILMPIFSVQKTSTQLTVADGATIVIAGLMADGVQRVNDKVPILGDLPLVGRLFQSVASKPVSTAVIFLVHVELIDPTGRPYRDR